MPSASAIGIISKSLIIHSFPQLGLGLLTRTQTKNND